MIKLWLFCLWTFVFLFFIITGCFTLISAADSMFAIIGSIGLVSSPFLYKVSLDLAGYTESIKKFFIDIGKYL